MAKVPRAIFIFLVILLIACVVSVFAYLLWPPSPQVQITSLSIYPQNNSNCDPFTATWNIVFDVKNPNIWSFEYKDVTVSIYYKHQFLSISSSADSFHQSMRSHAKYQTSVLVQNNVGDEINAEYWRHGVHAFNILMHAKFIYNPVSILWTRHRRMTVGCSNVEVELDPINKFGFTGRPKKCVVI